MTKVLGMYMSNTVYKSYLVFGDIFLQDIIYK